MMITTLTTLRWNALVMVGCSLLASTAAVATTQQPDAVQSQQPTVMKSLVPVADAKRQTAAAAPAAAAAAALHSLLMHQTGP